MSSTTWKQNGSHSRIGKRRFDEINNTIECLKSELYFNDIILKNELDFRIYSDNDREIMAAELYKERLEALATASRSQIWRVQSRNSPVPENEFHLDYDSWNPKRMKYAEGCSQINNMYYQDWGVNKRKRKNRKRNKKTVPMKPTASEATASIASSLKCTAILVPTKNNTKTKAVANTTSVTSNTTVPLSNNISAKVFNPVVKTNTATKKTGAMTSAVSVAKIKAGKSSAVKCVTTSQISVVATNNRESASVGKRGTSSTTSTASVPALSSVKTESNINAHDSTQNIPSLFSCDLSCIKFEFPQTDGVTAKYENSFFQNLRNSASSVKIKTEPVIDEDVMVDDLADHL